MDAAEADFDGKLYKASADLIREIRVKLPQLIFCKARSPAKLRSHVVADKCDEVCKLLDRFQEWPQLLDPHLGALLQMIVDAYLQTAVGAPQNYCFMQSRGSPGIVPLTRALSRLIYTACKVRGYKVIVRLLNNEPKYIESMLSCFRLWNTPQTPNIDQPFVPMVWEERYVFFLWLSHLMLAPFELSTLSTTNVPQIPSDMVALYKDLPPVAADVLSIAFDSLHSPGKDRESAVMLVARLALRKDMQQLHLPLRLVQFSTQALRGHQNQTPSVHYVIGHLGLLYSIMNIGSDAEVLPFLKLVQRTTSELAQSIANGQHSILDSAPTRKLLVKIIRSTISHAVSIAKSTVLLTADDLNLILEDGIQYFLEALGDKDTPVRMAASKALSIVARILESTLSAEVIEAVVGILSENILLEDGSTSKLVAATDLLTEEAGRMKKNLSAVDPLKWHGCMLTLGHVLFRRSPPVYQLPEIVEALLHGLQFEQRSNVGTSLGVGVRDAACFGIWSLARKYSSPEIEQINLHEMALPTRTNGPDSRSALQSIANQLVVSACIDPSGNIRRGSSAALQELIGRHPDLISQGIPLVQTVDYLAVARRSRAMIEVSSATATLDAVYRMVLLEAVLDWRGVRAADADSRHWAAAAVSRLVALCSDEQKSALLFRLVAEVKDLKPSNLGVTAGARHGLLLSIGAVVDCLIRCPVETRANLLPGLLSLPMAQICGSIDGKVNADLENVFEGLTVLISSVARLGLTHMQDADNDMTRDNVHRWAVTITPLLNRCTISSEKENLVEACVRANKATFALLPEAAQIDLIQTWLDSSRQRTAEMMCRGRLMTLATLFPSLDKLKTLQTRLFWFLSATVTGGASIEVRTHAMRSIGVILGHELTMSDNMYNLLGRTLKCGLCDYTNDQRGDIGSHLRLQSLEALNSVATSDQIDGKRRQLLKSLLPYIGRLAVEKLNKVRHAAWFCLKNIQNYVIPELPLTGNFTHLPDVSSEEYFAQMMRLFDREEMQEQLLIGLSASACGGTEDIGRVCCAAFLKFVDSHSMTGRSDLMEWILDLLTSHLITSAQVDDKAVIPVLEFLSFLIEAEKASEKILCVPARNIFDILQQAQSSTPSLARTEALTKVYNALLGIESLRTKALDKLTRQLLHRWPKVRNTAADMLYLNATDPLLVDCDWNAPVAENKSAVLRLRQALNVATATQPGR